MEEKKKRDRNTPSQRRATTKYIKNNYDRFVLTIRKDGEITKEQIKAAADLVGESVNEYITKSIELRVKTANKAADDEEIPEKVISNSIEWLKAHGHTEKDLIDYLKYI